LESEGGPTKDASRSTHEPHSDTSGQVLRFSGVSVTRGFDHLEITTALNTDGTATVILSTETATNQPIDYRGVVRIEHLQPGQKPIGLYAGWVTSATVSDDGVALELRNMEMFRQGRFAGFSTSGIPIPEVVWSLGRFAGMEPASLHIEGFRPQRELFRVVMPVIGLVSSGALANGLIKLSTDDGDIRRRLGRLSKMGEDSARAFLAPGRWASVTVKAQTLFEAEQEGVLLIQGALDRTALEAHYSLAFGPDGAPRSFQRDNLFVNPQHTDAALVEGQATGRRWFHVLTDLPREADVSLTRSGFQTPRPTSQPRFDEALRAWRRAVNATEAIEAATALSEAIEFYASGTHVARLFTDPEMAAIQQALDSVPFNDEQRRRLDGFAGTANQPPLLMRLRAALDTDGVPYSDEDFEAVRRVRAYRNRFVHGRERGEPISNDLDIVKAVVNRMLVFRGRITASLR
jgi:hypothetical protein